jgi:serine/threonine protein phosphatase PrpC
MEAVSLQTGSKQDYTVCGFTTRGQYIAVFDGHGFDTYIDHVRGLNMNDVMKTDNPLLTLWDLMQELNSFRSGSTVSMARITGTRIETWSMGDSEIHVFINGLRVYSSEVHTFLNPSEIERTRSMVRIRDARVPFPVSETRVELVNSPVGDFKCGESLIPSQSLGHNGITGFAPSTNVIQFKSTDKVRIVGGSDGLFDMLVDVSTGSAQQLVDEAERRWRMKWDFFDGTRLHKTAYDSIDDISCVIYENQFPTLCIPYSLMPLTQDDVRSVFDSMGTLHIEEEIAVDHKVFFLHFSNGSETLTQIYEKLRQGGKVKIWIRETWFWHVCFVN